MSLHFGTALLAAAIPLQQRIIPFERVTLLTLRPGSRHAAWGLAAAASLRPPPVQQAAQSPAC
eukprot:6406362-Pyramimonas_sp.AAC.1